MSSDRLDAFAEGRLALEPETMQALVQALWHGHVECDAAHYALRPAAREAPRPLGIRPPPIDPATLPTFGGSSPPIGPQPVTPQEPKETKRAGWLHGWL
jgi:hypothetical protein